MTYIKYLVIFQILIFLQLNLKGQSSYSFTYDDAGNATYRYVPVAKSTKSLILDTTEVEKNIQNDILEESIKIYPNPVTDLLFKQTLKLRSIQSTGFWFILLNTWVKYFG